MSQEGGRLFPDTVRRVVIVALRVALIAALLGAGWLMYRELPTTSSATNASLTATNLQIVMRQPENDGPALDVLVSLYPVDVVAVRHEFFTEPRAGKRFEDFLKERMKGRSPVSTRLDKEGHASVTLSPGSWWLHAILSGDEQLEWRLPVTVRGAKQTVELTPQNAYTRSRTF
jgi:hypothetical protein